MEPQWEIALVSGYSSPAVQVIGPFKDRQAACDAMQEYNKDNKIKGYKWMWAPWKEIERKRGCLLSEPTN